MKNVITLSAKPLYPYFRTFIFCLLIVLSSCSEDDPTDDPAVTIGYGVAIVAGAGDVQTTYLKGLENLDISSLDNSNSFELGQFASIYSDGNALFAAGFGAPATMGKYIFDNSGKTMLDEEVIVPGSNSFSAVEIVDENTGYATVGGGISRAIVFDPTAMRITGEIDLSEAGDGLFYSDMIVRDNVLFIALNDFGGSGEAKVAVVNLETNELEKVIADDRTTTLFGTLTTSIMTQDSNGNIYVQGSGLFSGKNSGVLRIKSGETEFDPDYFFDLKEATGYTCFGLYQFGDDLAFTAISEDDNNFFGTDPNPSFRYRKIDLAAKSDTGDLDSSIPNTFSASKTMFFTQVSDEEILFPIAGKDEDALYSYSIGSGSVTKKIVSNGGFITGLIKIDQ